MINSKPEEYLILLFCLGFMTGCSAFTQQTPKPVQHADSFYNVNLNDYPLLHLPLIDPIVADSEDGRTPWRVFLYDGPHVKVPDRKDNYYYGYAIEELDKFAICDGVIMAYSAYVDINADLYIQDNYYHWFVVIPGKRISEGFQTEDEFNTYIQSLGITDPLWLKPDDAYEQFEDTGCLEWFPDCE